MTVTVFWYSIVTDSFSKMFSFSMVSSFWVIIFDCVFVFNELKAVFGCLTVTDLMPLFFTVLDTLWIFLPSLFKINLFCSMALVEPDILLSW